MFFKSAISRFIFLRKNTAKFFHTPLPIIFSSKFHFGKVENFIQILLEFLPCARFIAKNFDITQGVDFGRKIHFRKSQNFMRILIGFYRSIIFDTWYVRSSDKEHVLDQINNMYLRMR